MPDSNNCTCPHANPTQAGHVPSCPLYERPRTLWQEWDQLDAYYYGFSEPETPWARRILCAIAKAGKAFHHTEMWCEPWPKDGDESIAEFLQRVTEESVGDAERHAKEDRDREWRKAFMGEPGVKAPLSPDDVAAFIKMFAEAAFDTQRDVAEERLVEWLLRGNRLVGHCGSNRRCHDGRCRAALLTEYRAARDGEGNG